MSAPTAPVPTGQFLDQAAALADSAVQRVADAAIWVLFRATGVRS